MYRLYNCRSSGLHQSLPPGERRLRFQEEDQVGEEESGSSLQPGPRLLRKPPGEGGAGEMQLLGNTHGHRRRRLHHLLIGLHVSLHSAVTQGQGDACVEAAHYHP